MDFFTDDTNVWVGQNLGHDVLTLSHYSKIILLFTALKLQAKEFLKTLIYLFGCAGR